MFLRVGKLQVCMTLCFYISAGLKSQTVTLISLRVCVACCVFAWWEKLWCVIKKNRVSTTSQRWFIVSSSYLHEPKTKRLKFKKKKKKFHFVSLWFFSIKKLKNMYKSLRFPWNTNCRGNILELKIRSARGALIKPERRHRSSSASRISPQVSASSGVSFLPLSSSADLTWLNRPISQSFFTRLRM